MTKSLIDMLSPWEINTGKAVVIVAAVAAIGDAVMFLIQTIFGWIWMLVAICLVAIGYWLRHRNKDADMFKFTKTMSSEFTAVDKVKAGLRQAIILAKHTKPEDRLIVLRLGQSYILLGNQAGTLGYAFVSKYGSSDLVSTTVRYNFWNPLTLVAGPVQQLASGSIVKQTQVDYLVEAGGHIFHKDRLSIENICQNLLVKTTCKLNSLEAPALMNPLTKSEHKPEFYEAVEMGIAYICGAVTADQMPENLKLVYSSSEFSDIVHADGRVFLIQTEEQYLEERAPRTHSTVAADSNVEVAIADEMPRVEKSTEVKLTKRQKQQMKAKAKLDAAIEAAVAEKLARLDVNKIIENNRDHEASQVVEHAAPASEVLDEATELQQLLDKIPADADELSDDAILAEMIAAEQSEQSEKVDQDQDAEQQLSSN